MSNYASTPRSSSSSQHHTNPFGTANLGSYRVDKQKLNNRHYNRQVNDYWAHYNPVSLSTCEEVLHLTPTQIRAEDYYLIRNNQLTQKDLANVQKSVFANAYNLALNNHKCNKLPSFGARPYDLEAFKKQKRQAKAALAANTLDSNNVFKGNDSLTSTSSLPNLFNKQSPFAASSNSFQPQPIMTPRPTTNVFQDASNKIISSSNIFSRGQTPQTNPAPAVNTVTSSTNIFARNNPTFNPSTNNPAQTNIFNNNPTRPTNIFSNNNNNIFNKDNFDRIWNQSNNPNNIFANNIFRSQQLQANAKKEIEITIKLSEDNVIRQKIVTIDNNIKIELDCSQMVNKPAIKSQAVNSIPNPALKAPENKEKETKRQVREQNKQQRRIVGSQKQPHKKKYNFDEKQLASSQKRYQKYDFSLKVVWLQGVEDDRRIQGTIEGFEPTLKEWRKKFLEKLKEISPIARRNARLNDLSLENTSKGAMIIGEIQQEMLNLDYSVQYLRLTCKQVFGLRISNQHGSIFWQGPVKIDEIDFQDFDFEINENEVMMPPNNPLNSPCLVRFNRLPKLIQRMIDQDDHEAALEKLSSIVMKIFKGSATLKELNKNYWQMQVSEFL